MKKLEYIQNKDTKGKGKGKDKEEENTPEVNPQTEGGDLPPPPPTPPPVE